MKYLKKFENHAQYETFIGGGGDTPFVKPNVSLCTQENEVHYNPYVHNYADDYLTFVALEDGTFTLSSNAVSYSLDDGETWTELAANTASPTVAAGNKIMWKGTITPSSSYGVGTFSATGNFDVQGNPMSILYGDNYKGQTDLTGKDYAFYRLFNNNIKVVNTENLSLPATTLANSCYVNMFAGCTGLVASPELPATTLVSNCYSHMFASCTSLATAPELPATTLTNYCYDEMFLGCTSLVNAPELPATTLADSCYRNMFRNCTNLVNVPDELPATTLAQSCYSFMFYGCTSLEKAPAILSTGYARWAFSDMYSGCENLNYIKTMITTIVANSQYTPKGWANGVSSSGTFVMNSAAEWNPEDYRGEKEIVPNNWTVQTASA